MNSKKVKKNKKPAIFLDRDGVINKEVDQLSKIADFKMYEFSAPAIRKINEAGYLVIIVTNQPMIAKGFISESDVKKIHAIMQRELSEKGAKLDGIYYCPHHPDKGFPGEIQKLKIKCNCRKPNIGLIEQAVQDFNIDLSKSFFIGDTTTDAKTAENAKITFLGVETGYGLKDKKYPSDKKYNMYENVSEAVNTIIKK